MFKVKSKKAKGKSKGKKQKAKDKRIKADMKMNARIGIKERSFQFALRIIRIFSSVKNDDAGKIIGKQILRSGTSIGANIEEAYAGQSKKDFTNKMTIALKESRETNYWLRLIRDSELMPANRMNDIILESDELSKILGKTVITSKKNM